MTTQPLSGSSVASRMNCSILGIGKPGPSSSSLRYPTRTFAGTTKRGARSPLAHSASSNIGRASDLRHKSSQRYYPHPDWVISAWKSTT